MAITMPASVEAHSRSALFCALRVPSRMGPKQPASMAILCRAKLSLMAEARTEIMPSTACESASMAVLMVTVWDRPFM